MVSDDASRGGFVPPVYPHDRLRSIKEIARERFGVVIDLSIGTPVDPPPEVVIEALSTSNAERGYPTSIGSEELRAAMCAWIWRSFGVRITTSQIAATVGSKEFVASLPTYLKLRAPAKRFVLYPEVSYPTYEMGALLGGLTPYRVRQGSDGRLLLREVPQEVVSGALVLWINLPSNPTGAIAGMGEAVAFAKAHGILLASDECYSDFRWEGDSESVLNHANQGILAVHSLSKRSNLAGLRVGSYSGDPELVSYLREVRKHAGLIVPGPVQRAASLAYSDDTHVKIQREVYRRRLGKVAAALQRSGFDVQLPRGGFYLWFEGPNGRFSDGFALASFLAERAGVIASPGEFYGPTSQGFVRLAMVARDDLVDELVSRLGDVTI